MNIHSDHVPYSNIFMSPSWRVTCCHQNWPLTCQQWLSNTVAVASLHEPNQTNSLWVFNLNNWFSQVWPLYIVGHDPVLSAHSVCACFLIVKTCRGTRHRKSCYTITRLFPIYPTGNKNTARACWLHCVCDLKIVCLTSQTLVIWCSDSFWVKWRSELTGIRPLVVLPV